MADDPEQQLEEARDTISVLQYRVSDLLTEKSGIETGRSVLGTLLAVAVVGFILLGLAFLDERDEASSCEGALDAYEFIDDTTGFVPRYEDDLGNLNTEKLDGWLAGHTAALFSAELVVIDHCGESPAG